MYCYIIDLDWDSAVEVVVRLVWGEAIWLEPIINTGLLGVNRHNRATRRFCSLERLYKKKLSKTASMRS